MKAPYDGEIKYIHNIAVDFHVWMEHFAVPATKYRSMPMVGGINHAMSGAE